MNGEWRPSTQYPDKHEYVVCGVVVGRVSLHWNEKSWYAEIRIIDPLFQFHTPFPLRTLDAAKQELEAYWNAHDMSHLIPETTQLSMFE